MRSCRAYSACPCGVLCVCVLAECASEKTSANRLTILPVWHRVNSTQQLRKCAVGWRYDSVRHGSQQDREDEYAKLGSWRWRQQGRVEVVVCSGCQGGKIFRWGAGPFKTHSLPCPAGHVKHTPRARSTFTCTRVNREHADACAEHRTTLKHTHPPTQTGREHTPRQCFVRHNEGMRPFCSVSKS